MNKRTITMFQLMECFADIAPDCEVTLINLDNNIHKYYVSGPIYVDLSKPHTLPKWCEIFNSWGVNFDDVLVRCWSIKSITNTSVPMVDKMVVFIKEK